MPQSLKIRYKDIYKEYKAEIEKDDPDFARLITNFQSISTIVNPTASDHEILGIVNLLLGTLKAKVIFNYEIKEQCLPYYQKAKESYEIILREYETLKNAGNYLYNMRFVELSRKINDLRYNYVLVLFRINEVLEDKENTLLGQNKSSLKPEEVLLKGIKILLDIDSKNIHILNALGVLYYKLGNLVEANYYFNQVGIDYLRYSNNKYDHFYFSSLYNKALVLIKEQHFKESLEKLTEYHKSRSLFDKPVVLSTIGIAYLLSEDYEKSLEYYKDSYDKRVDSNSLNGVAISKLLLGRNLVEIEYSVRASLKYLKCEDLIKSDEKNIDYSTLDKYTIAGKELIIESLMIIASAHIREQGMQLASLYVQKAKAISSHYKLSHSAPIFLESLILIDNHEYKKAKKLLEQVMKLNPKFPEVYNALGVCEYNLNNIEESQEMFSQAIELKPVLVTAHINLNKIKISRKSNSGEKFWTKTNKRKIGLTFLIALAVIVGANLLYAPNVDNINTKSSNYTIIENGITKDIIDHTEENRNTNSQIIFGLLAIIVVIIIWPSLRNFKIGPSTIEIEKISTDETKEEIYSSWISTVDLLYKSRLNPYA